MKGANHSHRIRSSDGQEFILYVTEALTEKEIDAWEFLTGDEIRTLIQLSGFVDSQSIH